MKALAWLAVAGFLLHGNWEWLQSPFYNDSTASLDRIVWFRLHCTLGDVLILVVGALAVSLVVRSMDWLHRPRWGPIALLTAGAILYTVGSERRNLDEGAWSYSELMPVVPWLDAGVAPLMQWLILSPLSVFLAARLSRGDPK